MIWRACRCQENELVSTRDLGTGSLLSTFSVGRTRVVEGGAGVLRGGGEERSMTRLRLAPRSLWGPLGPPQSSPLTAADFFLSPFKSILFCFLFIYLILFFLSFYLTISSCLLFKKHAVISRGHHVPVSTCIPLISISFFYLAH